MKEKDGKDGNIILNLQIDLLSRDFIQILSYESSIRI